MAGRVAVQIVFVESDGSAERSTENWTPEQMTTVKGHIAEALAWWRTNLPNARLNFDLTSTVVGTRYEPIAHDLSTENLWIGDTLSRMGYSGASYFDQAYAADDALRQARNTDWATTLFLVNSTNDADGRFTDGMFAYAYIGGPFLVLTSDAGLYGTQQLTPIATHELGHIFGALDQYASAATPCTLESGYLSVPTTNSQLDGCGTHFTSIMLEPIAAFPGGQIDASALGQIGYRDSDDDTLPDPLDTVPVLQMTFTQPASGRPAVTGSAADQPYLSTSEAPVTINTIAHVEYRVDGGAWAVLPAADGAYDSAEENITTTLPLYDGSHKLDLRAINSVGAASPLISRNVTVAGVGAQPSFAIKAPKLSNSAAITLTLAAPASAAAQISEDPSFAGAAWAPVTASTSWDLTPVDGEHTLYIRFRDNKGIESPAFAQSVMLDRTAPSGRALLHGDNTLEQQAEDTGSGVASVEVGGSEPGAWQPFRPTLPIPHGLKDVQVRFRDAAGNVSSPVSASSNTMIYLPVIIRR
jgi:hypothetical protein